MPAFLNLVDMTAKSKITLYVADWNNFLLNSLHIYISTALISNTLSRQVTVYTKKIFHNI